jgi:hypothetical protein
MHDSFGVCGLKGVDELRTQGQNRIDVEGTATNAIGKRLAVEQLHDDEVLRLELLDAVNDADIGMIERRCRARLSPKAL